MLVENNLFSGQVGSIKMQIGNRMVLMEFVWKPAKIKLVD